MHYALSLALVSLAMGREVIMFCTYGGLRRLVRGCTEALGDETPSDMREVFQRGLAKGAITPLGELLREARTMGLRVYACVGAMAQMNIARDELIDEVTASAGLAFILDLAKGAEVVLYV